jgi:hypothetical protein
MLRFTKDQFTHALISFSMLAVVVFSSVDACFARYSSNSAWLADDDSRIVLAAAAFFCFLLAAFRGEEENQAS